MLSTSRPVVAAIAAALLAMTALAACGDDANDHALQQRRLADRAASIRTSSTIAQTPLEAPEPADGATSDSTAPTVTVATVEPTGVVIAVQAIDNTFRPQVIEISVGDEVFWENRGLNDHNVLYVDGDDWGIEVEGFGPGAAYAHIFTEPGEYRYYCSIHGNETVGMTGTVIVTG